MPSITDILEAKKKKKKPFVKRDYRPWNINGDTVPPSISEAIISETTVNNNTPLLDEVNNINTDKIVNWRYHDRPETELGDIKALAEEFKTIGQQQPCIARPCPNDSSKYELIVGERRWRAAIEARLSLKVLVKNLNDSDSALIQASENSSRKDLSDYAKGMSYSRLLNDGVVTHKQLFDKIGVSKQKLSSLLSFSRLPEEFCKEISDFSKISSRTAEEIFKLWNKGEDYQKSILPLIKALEEGKIGHMKLNSLVESQINRPSPKRKHNEKILSSNGRHLFTWREDNNMQPSVHFPSDIVHLFKTKKLDQQKTTEKFVRMMEEMLKEISE